MFHVKYYCIPCLLLLYLLIHHHFLLELAPQQHQTGDTRVTFVSTLHSSQESMLLVCHLYEVLWQESPAPPEQ